TTNISTEKPRITQNQAGCVFSVISWLIMNTQNAVVQAPTTSTIISLLDISDPGPLFPACPCVGLFMLISGKDIHDLAVQIQSACTDFCCRGHGNLGQLLGEFDLPALV